MPHKSPNGEPLILAVAPNGARLQKAKHANVPIEADELAHEAKACAAAGATLFHLHVRDHEGAHILDADLYRTAIQAIRSTCPKIVVQVTTEAVGQYNASEQIDLIHELRPESFSIAIRELIPDASAEAKAQAFIRWACDEGIHVQHILYSIEDITRFKALLESSIICDNYLLPLLVCGRYVEQIDSVGAYEQFATETYAFQHMYCGFGQAENIVADRAIASGAHCRIGFENNLYNKDGAVAQTNAERIREIADLSDAHGRPLATIDYTRRILGLDS